MGERVNFDDDERADIPDINAIQTLVYEQLGRVLGGVLGPSFGTFSRIEYTVSEVGGQIYVDIGEGLLFYADYTTGKTRLADGLLIRHDPTLAGQSSQVNVTAFEPASDEPFIWAALQEIESDSDTRRKWDTGTSNEVAYTQLTRVRQRVLFSVSITQPVAPADSAWFPIAQITDWAAGTPKTPVLTNLHVLDARNVAGDQFDDNKRRFARVYSSANNVMGVSELTAWVLNELLGIKDTAATAGTNPNDTYALNDGPARGLFQLDDGLSFIESYFALYSSQNTYLAGWASVDWDDTAGQYVLLDQRGRLRNPGSGGSLTTFTSVNTGRCSFEFANETPGIWGGGWAQAQNRVDHLGESNEIRPVFTHVTYEPTARVWYVDIYDVTGNPPTYGCGFYLFLLASSSIEV